jgi:hypothetical protein
MIGHMWRDDLHPANFASMALGSWAALVLVDEPRPRWQLVAGLSLLLVFLSLSYQYQWIMIPLLAVLVATQPRLGVRRGLPIVGAAVAVYALSTVAIREYLAATVGPATTWLNAATQPGPLIVQRFLAVRSVAGSLNLLPHSWDYAQFVQAYQPIVVVAALAGILTHGRRLAALVGVGVGVSLFSLTYYSAPWAATNAYPFVYAAAAVAFTSFGHAAARVSRTVLPANTRLATALRYAASLSCVLVVAAIANADLAGDPTLPVRWWSYFYGHFIF